MTNELLKTSNLKVRDWFKQFLLIERFLHCVGTYQIVNLHHVFELYEILSDLTKNSSASLIAQFRVELSPVQGSIVCFVAFELNIPSRVV